MAQYEKLINLSLLSQFLAKAKTIFSPKITASGILKGDGAGNVSTATAGTDYATPDSVDAKYTKPGSGIPESDLDAETAAAIEKAKTAIQEHQSLASYRTAVEQDTHDEPYLTKLAGIENGAQVNVDEVVVSETEPTDPNAKLWIYQHKEQKIEIPTMEDFRNLKPATDEQVAEAVSTWLEENVSGGETLVVDKTLTIDGAGADAKVVGEKLAKINSDLDAIDIVNKAPVIIDTASGSIASFPDGMTAPLKKLVVDIEPVQDGTGDPSPDNVRPISGWTRANVTCSGKNMIPIDISQWDQAKINQLNAYVDTEGYLNIIADRNYNTLYLDLYEAYREYRGIYLRPTKYVVSVLGCQSATIRKYGGGNVGVSNAPFSGGFYLSQIFTALSNVTIGDQFRIGMQLEEGTAVTSYEPFHGDTCNVAFGASAGTVYGGTLTINEDGTGELVSEWANVIFDGSEDELWEWRTTSTTNPYAHIKLPDMKYSNWGDGFCNRAKTETNHAELSNDFVVGFGWSYENRIYFFNPSIYLPGVSDLASWKTWLSSNNVQVVYQLATPNVYHFDNLTQLFTTLGTNNIWADCGDVDVEYRADTKLYIQRINAPADNDMTADTQIASGKYFIVGGNLYLSTTTIPAGDTITPGTNCQQTNLAEALNALNT